METQKSLHLQVRGSTQLDELFRRGSIRYTSTRGYGKQITGQFDFHWPGSQSDLKPFTLQGENLELTGVTIKGQQGRHLQGIGLEFTDGVTSPFFERQAYGNSITFPQSLQLDLEVPQTRIEVKVLGSGDNTVITGLRIGTTNRSALHCEWKKQGTWQEPIEVFHNEQIVGVRG